MRISYSEDEDFGGQFELWQANCRRSLQGKAGQSALQELEAALLAMPDKRLIANKLIDAEGDVCSLGALAKYKGHELTVPKGMTADGFEDFDEIDLSGEMEDFGVELGMPRLVAWKVVELNDVQIDGHYVPFIGPIKEIGYRRPQVFIPTTPEERYEKVLAWVRKQLSSERKVSKATG